MKAGMASSWHRIPLDPPVPATHERELTARVFFVSDAILDFSLVRADRASAGVSAVDLAVPAGTDVGDLARKLRYVVANEVLAQRHLTPKTVWRGTSSEKVRDVFSDLLRQGIVWEAAEGQITVGEPVLSLMDHLDARIKDLIVREFGARVFRYPTLIPTSVMQRCRYFQSFPHLMMVVSRLHADVDVYRSFLNDLDGGGDLADGLRAHAGGFDYCLPPTMCFHTYHQFADGPLPEATLAVTARGKSFRFESRYRRSLERLWDFTIREIVFMGPRDHVLACRRRLMECTWELMDALELGGRCEVANDPFFVNVDTVERVWSQHLLELKYELRLPLEAERDIAVCSFNFHDQFFGESFSITTDDGAAYTACAGFGLERLAYAFLCRHGVNPRGWPRSIREAVEP